jgi:hypothetical protein
LKAISVPRSVGDVPFLRIGWNSLNVSGNSLYSIKTKGPLSLEWTSCPRKQRPSERNFSLFCGFSHSEGWRFSPLGSEIDSFHPAFFI